MVAGHAAVCKPCCRILTKAAVSSLVDTATLWPIPLQGTPARPAQTMSSPYSRPARLLHWTVALLLIAQFLVSWFMPHIGRKTVPGVLINLHFSLGLLILLLMVLRLQIRWRHPVPLDSDSAASALESRLALSTHRVFYGVLLLVPLFGWAAASTRNLPVTLFGIPMPALAPEGSKLAHTAGDVHVWIMWGLLGLVVIHAAGALFHHFVRHDRVLSRMLG